VVESEQTIDDDMQVDSFATLKIHVLLLLGMKKTQQNQSDEYSKAVCTSEKTKIVGHKSKKRVLKKKGMNLFLKGTPRFVIKLANVK